MTRTRRRTRRTLAAAATALALLLPEVVAPPSAGAQTGSATLTASAAQVAFGEPVALSGAVEAGADCVAGRTVSLQSKPAGAGSWADIDQGATAADGTFSFTETPASNAAYRAVLAKSSTCGAITSEQASVGVAVVLDGSLSDDSIAAGNCVRMDVSVAPDKPGQTVQVEQRGASGWEQIATATLGASSEASARICFEWSSIGSVDVRAEWVPQDDLNLGGVGPALSLEVVRAPWMDRIDGLAAGRAVSVSVGEDGEWLYRRADTVERAPASNEKLVLSMALLDELGPDLRIVTHAAAASVAGGVVQGDLWILGRGDPTIATARLRELARAIAGAGVRKVRGSIMGSTGYFRHDWFAPGWRSYFPRDFVALPSALTFNGNQVGGVHVSDPERVAATSLTKMLKARGVRVLGRPGAGEPPGGLEDVATIRSAPLSAILRRQNVDSVNLYAEVLGKLLGVTSSGPPGTIAKGARAVAAWARDHGVRLTAYDCSGLSYRDRVTAAGLVRLLWVAGGEPWGEVLRDTLPGPGQGTLEDRLAGVQVRAKTGTLTDISALSGWVWLEREDAWAEFSILSRGISKADAAAIEDAIVRTLSRNAR